MSKIENPWHSRSIDVHRWSDHPEVKEFVDRIWDECLPAEVVGRSGPRPKMAFRMTARSSKLSSTESARNQCRSCQIYGPAAQKQSLNHPSVGSPRL